MDTRSPLVPLEPYSGRLTVSGEKVVAGQAVVTATEALANVFVLRHLILLAGTMVWLWHRLTRPPAPDHRPVSYLRRLLTPIALVAAILELEQIGITQLG